MLKEFRDFIARGNVVDLAIGVVIGAAFGAVVNSLVKDIIMPPIGYLLKGVNFSDLFISLDGKSYPSLAVAQAAAAP
ncbi:MAG TPA: large conductance mechanosensitive channel protein MscL, partial [Anaerolineales bacterium]|nr:large conductance mechanosensitive channel protein MscL [Anaerolineales bacterium]